jgi:hypothetical protein
MMSDKANQICREHYRKNCGGCPLRKVCCSHIGAGQEAFERWQADVNRLAEEVFEANVNVNVNANVKEMV